jgi:hypothetical protein
MHWPINAVCLTILFCTVEDSGYTGDIPDNRTIVSSPLCPQTP